MYDDYDNYMAYIESLFILGLDVHVHVTALTANNFGNLKSNSSVVV